MGGQRMMCCCLPSAPARGGCASLLVLHPQLCSASCSQLGALLIFGLPCEVEGGLGRSAFKSIRDGIRRR